MSDKMCIVCNVVAATDGPRCRGCHNSWRAKNKREREARKRKEDIAKNEELIKLGWCICTHCHHKRQISEFRTSLDANKGVRNNICDRCLTRIYTSDPSRTGTELTPHYWRKRAYSCNTAARSRVARELGKKTKDIELSEMPWICKPQDLAELFNRQMGCCPYCGVSLKKGTFQIDHIHPMSKGGTHSIDNLHITCIECNCLKQTYTHTDFKAFIKEYAKRVLAHTALEA